MTSKNLKKFKLIKDSKSPSMEWSRQNISKSLKLYESDYKGNLGIACGKVNNIIVVDTDFYKGESEEFIKEFGKKYYDNFDTFTNQTGTGGFHMYFKYDSDITNIINDKHNIDVFTDNKYVVSDGSIVKNNGKYISEESKKYLTYTTYNDTDIKPLPPQLKEWIQLNLLPKEKEKKNKIIKKQLKENTNNTDISYNIPKNEIIKIVKKFDERYWNNRDDFLRWTSFCKVLNCKDIWDKINKKKPNYDKDKNDKEYWNMVQPYTHIVDTILKENKQDHIIDYYKLKTIKIKDVEYAKTINKEKLGYTFIDKKTNYVIRSDTGTGKTTSFKHYIKETDQKFISIVSRISLGEEQYNSFNEFGIQSQYYQFLNKCEAFENDDNCIVTIDSIIKLRELDVSEYVLFLDEYASIIEYLIISSTLDKNRSIIYQLFNYLIKNCKQVICTDADINQYCIDFLNYTKIKFTTINNTYLHNKDVCASEIYSHNIFIDKLKSEKSFLCCTDSKVNAELIYKEINGKNDEDCILIVSGVDEYVNLDSHKKVIFSPKIIYGLDSIIERPVYTYYKEHTINPSNMVQQISRCRNITKLQYLFSKKNYIQNNITLEEATDFNINSSNDSILYFKEVCDKNVVSNYIDLLSKYTYQNMCYDTNKFAHFLSILKERGFKITYDYQKTTAKISNELKELKEDKLNDFDPKSNVTIKINNYLNIPDSQIELYKDLFIDKIKLQNHFTMSKYLNNDNNDHLGELIDNKDFSCNKFTSTKMKLLLINEIKDKCGCKDGVNLTKKLSKNDRIKYMNTYNSVFRNRDTSANMDDLFNTQKLFIKMMKNTLDNKYITSTRIKKTNNYTYSVNEDNVEYHSKIYKFRQNEIIPTKNLFK